MIIEAGYDVIQLVSHEIRFAGKKRKSLWLIGMDSDLRLVSIERPIREMLGSPLDHVRELALSLKTKQRPRIKYFALAFYVDRDMGISGDWLHELDAELRKADELEGAYLLGQVAFDRTGYYQTVPRYSFRDYFGLEDLPRTAIFAGPHPFLDCPCGACVQHEERLRQNRERNSDMPVDPFDRQG